MKHRKKQFAEQPTLPAWTPFQLAEALPELGDDAIFLNSRYQVNVRFLGDKPPFGKTVWLSIKRRDRQPLRNWRDLQRIKNELCGPETEGMEMFPAESRHVDSANQYHLFVFQTFKFPFGFSSRYISETSNERGSVQEPFEEGLRPPDCGSLDGIADRYADQIRMRMALRSAKGIAEK